jgi:hypothetical protein
MARRPAQASCRRSANADWCPWPPPAALARRTAKTSSGADTARLADVHPRARGAGGADRANIGLGGALRIDAAHVGDRGESRHATLHGELAHGLRSLGRKDLEQNGCTETTLVPTAESWKAHVQPPLLQAESPERNASAVSCRPSRTASKRRRKAPIGDQSAPQTRRDVAEQSALRPQATPSWPGAACMENAYSSANTQIEPPCGTSG